MVRKGDSMYPFTLIVFSATSNPKTISDCLLL